MSKYVLIAHQKVKKVLQECKKCYILTVRKRLSKLLFGGYYEGVF